MTYIQEKCRPEEDEHRPLSVDCHSKPAQQHGLLKLLGCACMDCFLLGLRRVLMVWWDQVVWYQFKFIMSLLSKQEHEHRHRRTLRVGCSHAAAISHVNDFQKANVLLLYMLNYQYCTEGSLWGAVSWRTSIKLLLWVLVIWIKTMHRDANEPLAAQASSHISLM